MNGFRFFTQNKMQMAAFPAPKGIFGVQRLLLACLLLTALLAQAQSPDESIAARLREHYASLQATPDQPDSVDARLQAFYAARNFQPAWTNPARLDALLAELRKLDADGLDPRIYPLDALQSGRGGDPVSLDLLASRTFLQALMDLHRGKVDPTTLAADWRIERPALDPGFFDAAFAAVGRDDIAGAFEQARPHHPLYLRLREALQKLRELQARGGWPEIATGPALKPGMTDARVPTLRTRLALENYLAAPPPAEPLLYDKALSQAVRDYQNAQFLRADGQLGDATREMLNVPVDRRIDQIRVNLERARWLLPKLESDLVIVDVAGFRVTLYRGAEPVWRARVQVGRETRRTPLLKSEIRYLTLNPTWTVPPTILKKDILPKVRKNIGYLARERIRVFDAQGNEIPADQVDWSKPRGLTLRQDAGPGAALGNVAFRFPNPFSIYLHDTPHQELFDKGQRTYSSGCIRVEHAHELAVLLFNDPVRWSADAFEKALSDNKTRNVMLPKPVPILIAYWTADLRPDGEAAFKPDVYGQDDPTLAALDQPYPGN